MGGDHDDEEEPDRLQGRLGRVTVPIPAGRPGEVLVEIRGGTERYAAWSDQPIPKHSPVVIVGVRSPRSLDVVPFPEAEMVVKR